MNLLNITEEGLNANTAVELRKAASQLGIKGASKGRKADLIPAIMELVNEARKAEAAKAPAPAAPAPAKNMCVICGIRRGSSKNGRDYRDQCDPCHQEAGWENTHSDAGHIHLDLGALTEEQAAEVYGCWICYPELNLAKRPARVGRSRAGMEIIAKGTEIHKSNTFKAAAEKAGWTIKVHTETFEGGNIRHYADASNGENAIQLAWNGRAYDYPASSARVGGKDRKVRNLKEALRLLEA
jgi:hypothetical protein